MRGDDENNSIKINRKNKNIFFIEYSKNVRLSNI